MGVAKNTIQCRKCKESIPLEEGNCPHCGTGIRSTGKLGIVSLIGVVIAVTSVLNIGQLWFFFLLGIGTIIIAGLLLYDKRQRMK